MSTNIWDESNSTGTESDATAANQVTGNNLLNDISTNIGAKADEEATTDSGTFSLIALFKRLLGKYNFLATASKQDTGNNSLASIDSGIKYSDSASLDAFGRLRTSEPANRFDCEMTSGIPLVLDQVTNTGSTITFDTTERDANLNIINTTTGSYAVLAGHYNAPYTPGRSQAIDITGTLNPTNEAGAQVYIFLRNNGTDSDVLQSNWLYASNASTVNWRYSQIFAMDFQSLRVGRIRFGLVRNGIFKPVHEIYNDNTRISGYWQEPNGRPYWRIYNDASNTYTEIGYGDIYNGIGFKLKHSTKIATASLKAICATVKSEGGRDLFDMAGFPFQASKGVTAKTVANTLIPVLSIKVQPTFNSLPNNSLILPQGFTLNNDNPINYHILLNPTLTGANFVQAESNSSVFYDVTASAVTGGIKIKDDYASAGQTKVAVTRNVLGKIIMSANWLYTDGDILTIAAQRVTNSSAATFVAIEWNEIR